jgi:GNAT superfamily N-acetyltransferase
VLSLRHLRGYCRTGLDDLRRQGIPVLAWKIAVKLVSPIASVQHQILFETDLTQPVAERRPRVDCRIEAATEDDLDRITAMRFEPPPSVDPQVAVPDEFARAYYARQSELFRDGFRENVRQCLRAGEMCFVARIGDEIAHINWVRFPGCTPVMRRPIRLLTDEVYTTDAYTAPRWRGKAVHEAVFTHMLRYASSLGFRRAYTITDLTKAESRRGVLRAGAKQRGHHLFITPRGWGRTWVVRLAGDIEPIIRDIPE